MWVKMLSTYIGGIGSFPKGHKLDLAPDIVIRIPEDCYEKCRAPWEEKTDLKANRTTELQKDLQTAQAKVDEIEKRETKISAQLIKVSESIKQFENDNSLQGRLKASILQTKINEFNLELELCALDLDNAMAEVLKAEAALGNFDKIYKIEKNLKTTEEAITKMDSLLDNTESKVAEATKKADEAKTKHKNAAEAVKRAKKKTAQPGDGYLIADVPKLKQASIDANKAAGKLSRELNAIKKGLDDAKKQESKLRAALEKLQPAKDNNNTEGQTAPAGQEQD